MVSHFPHQLGRHTLVERVAGLATAAFVEGRLLGFGHELSFDVEDLFLDLVVGEVQVLGALDLQAVDLVGSRHHRADLPLQPVKVFGMQPVQILERAAQVEPALQLLFVDLHAFLQASRPRFRHFHQV